MRIAILGRGLSLNRYANYSNLFEKIYISNNFKEEIPFIGLEHFVSKDIVHIVGVGKHNPLSSNQYKSLNIQSVQSNRFGSFKSAHMFKQQGVKVLKLPSCMVGRGYPSDVDWKKIHKHAAVMGYREFLSKIGNKNTKERGWPTTGILATDLALVVDNPSEVYLFGLDLYAKDYLVKKNLQHHSGDSPKSKMMFHHLRYLAEEFSQCKFYCSSEVDVGRDNWEVL